MYRRGARRWRKLYRVNGHLFQAKRFSRVSLFTGHISSDCVATNHPLPSARQHPSYGDCLEVKSEYYQNCSVLDCVTQCSQSAAHLYEQFLQVQQIGFVTL